MIRRVLVALFLAAATQLPAQNQVCSTTLVGPGCGATLTITFPPDGSHHAVQLDAAGLYPHEIGGMLWGYDPVTPWPVIPGSSCLVYTLPVWSFLFMSDTSGNWSWSRSWPPTYVGSFYMQVGNLHVLPNGSFDVTVTNCELAECHLQ